MITLLLILIFIGAVALLVDWFIHLRYNKYGDTL